MNKVPNCKEQRLSGFLNSPLRIPESHTKKQYRSSEIPKYYPHSQGDINLSKHCPYCGYRTGLIIIRFKDDIGFVRCGRCDAALYSLAEIGEVAK